MFEMKHASQLLVRLATKDDVPRLAALGATTFSNTFGHLYEPSQLSFHLAQHRSEASFHRYLREDHVLVAVADGSLAGYLKCGKVGLPVEAAEADMEVHQLYVDAAQQGQGIGRLLMDAALDLAPMARAPSIYLGVWEENFKAQRFYASYGFVTCGRYIYYVGEHADNELILRRERQADLAV